MLTFVGSPVAAAFHRILPERSAIVLSLVLRRQSDHFQTHRRGPILPTDIAKLTVCTASAAATAAPVFHSARNSLAQALLRLTGVGIHLASGSFRRPLFALIRFRTSLVMRQVQYASTTQPSPPPASGLLLLLIHVRVAVTANEARMRPDVGADRAMFDAPVDADASALRCEDGVVGCLCRACATLCIWIDRLPLPGNDSRDNRSRSCK